MATGLLAWARVLLLDGELAAAEPKKLHYRLLHVTARLTRGGHRLPLRISATWPWRYELTTAFHRLAALPVPPADRRTLAHHDPKGLGEPDHRSGTAPCPSTEIASATRQCPPATPHRLNRNGEARPNTGDLWLWYAFDPFGFGGVDDGDGGDAWAVGNAVGGAFEGPAGDFAFDDARVGPAASWWQEAFEEFSVGGFDRAGESAGGKTPPGR